jgi:hypothetical protein
MPGIQFRRIDFMGDEYGIDLQTMFPGVCEHIADAWRNGQHYYKGCYTYDWVRDAYRNAELLMLAGF